MMETKMNNITRILNDLQIELKGNELISNM